MKSDSTDRSTDAQHDSTSGVSRRTFIRTTTVAAVGAAGLGAASSSAVGQWLGGDIPELDFRGSTPSVSTAPVDDEVVFSVHGYSGSSASVSQAQEFASTAESLGYSGSVTAVTWDDGGLPSSAEASARETGPRLASFLEDYLDQNPQTTIRILGHSMGGIVTFEFIAAANGRFQVANADSIGSYEVSDAPCEGSGFHDAIDDVTKFTGNYFSTNDGIARLGDGPADCGFGGGSLPDNYADVDVSNSVGSHTSYKQSTGFGQAYLSNFQPGVDRGADGGDGDDGDGDDGDGDDGDGDDGDGDDGDTGDTAPAIDSLSASEVTFGNDVDVDWAVSDADGDLASVESVAISGFGNAIDSQTTSVSGSDASGSPDLDVPWYRSASTVQLTVTDAAGNETTQEDSV